MSEQRYRLFVNEQQTVKVELWPEGAYIAYRDDVSQMWGPPEALPEHDVKD